MLLNLTPDELLSTTRSVRKWLDFTRPVEPEVVRECLALALQAPNFGNGQRWRWMVVTDPTKRQALAECYRRGYDHYRQVATPDAALEHAQTSDPEQVARDRRRRESSDYLAEHMQDAPVMVIPCYLGRADGQAVSRQASLWGSMLPAAWSFMLALRAVWAQRGPRATWSTNAPPPRLSGFRMRPSRKRRSCLSPTPSGQTSNRARQPLDEVICWNNWTA